MKGSIVKEMFEFIWKRKAFWMLPIHPDPAVARLADRLDPRQRRRPVHLYAFLIPAALLRFSAKT